MVAGKLALRLRCAREKLFKSRCLTRTRLTIGLISYRVHRLLFVPLKCGAHGNPVFHWSAFRLLTCSCIKQRLVASRVLSTLPVIWIWKVAKFSSEFSGSFPFQGRLRQSETAEARRPGNVLIAASIVHTKGYPLRFIPEHWLPLKSLCGRSKLRLQRQAQNKSLGCMQIEVSEI
jgi:hypothetical protein